MNSPKVVAIVQARLGSTRLPGKALLDICGQTMLARTVTRAMRAKTVDETVVATTINASDEAIAAEATRLGIASTRGSEVDVLSRYLEAARAHQAEVIVRLTSDCPLLDPAILDLAVMTYLAAWPALDYVSNTVQRTFPRGLDVEVISRSALERAASDATLPYEREHVTPHLYEHPDLFDVLHVRNWHDFSDHRWTVDTQPDLEFVRAVCTALRKGDFTWQEVIALLDEQPGLRDLNRHATQKDMRG